MVYKMPQKFINILYMHGTVYCVIQMYGFYQLSFSCSTFYKEKITNFGKIFIQI